MAIEFRCTSCGKLLRTQPGTEGKKAKCPECGTILAIPAVPAAGAPPSFDAPPPREPDFASAPPPAQPAGTNPYQSPSAYGPAATVQRGFHPTRIEFGEIFGRTWQIFKANLGVCMGGTLLMFVCSMFVGVVVQVAFTPVLVNVEGAAFVVVWLLQQLVGQAITAFFVMGLIMFMLRIARGEPAEFGVLFSAGPLFIYGAALQMIVYLAAMAGFVLLIIPGIIIALMLSQAMYILVDQRTDIGSALKLSVEAMKGNKLTVLAIWIVAGFLGLLFTVLTCFIGALFLWPFMMALSAVTYLGVTGQKTILDGPAQEVAERGFGAAGVPTAD